MSSLRPVLGLITSILFAAAVGGMLDMPDWLPWGNVWRGIVFVVAAGAAPPPADLTLVRAIALRKATRRGYVAAILLIDVIAVALVLTFLNPPGTSLDLPARLLFAGAVAGMVPGWPSAGRQGAYLFKRRRLT